MAGSGPVAQHRWRTWARDAAVVLAIYVGISAWQSRHALPRGSLAPALSLPSVAGETVSLEQLRGRAVLVHFWATWCGVCTAEIGSVRALSANLPRNTALVTVAVDSGTATDVARFVHDHGIDYPVLLGDSSVAPRFGATVFPTDYYLSPTGRIEAVTTGMSLRWIMWARLAWAR